MKQKNTPVRAAGPIGVFAFSMQAVVFRTDAVFGGKGAVKIRIVVESAATADIIRLFAFKQELFCEQKPFQHDIAINAGADLFAESM